MKHWAGGFTALGGFAWRVLGRALALPVRSLRGVVE